jgi:hypothetical protein
MCLFGVDFILSKHKCVYIIGVDILIYVLC